MKNNKKGFTLVELVIVVAVMAILVAVAIPTIGSITKSAQSSVENTNCRTIESVIKLAEADLANAAADGKGVLTDTAIDAAITNAKLGIETGNFIYDNTTGAVTVGSSASGTNQFKITFNAKAADAADIVKVEQGKNG